MAELTEPDTIRDQVREKYAAAARAAAAGTAAPASCCGPTEVPLTDASGAQVFGDALYESGEAAGAGQAVAASLGCGVPTAVADLHEGETVLDLGSGAALRTASTIRSRVGSPSALATAASAVACCLSTLGCAGATQQPAGCLRRGERTGAVLLTGRSMT